MNKEYQKLRQISTVLKKILFYPPLPPSTEVSYFLGPYCNQNITFNLKRGTKCETTNVPTPACQTAVEEEPQIKIKQLLLCYALKHCLQCRDPTESLLSLMAYAVVLAFFLQHHSCTINYNHTIYATKYESNL